MSPKSIRHLVMLALLTAIALTIFVLEAQIPIPVPIPGVKLGLANVITLLVLVKFRVRDAVAVLLLRILMGSIFTGTVTTMLYSLSGGLLCLFGMAVLCRLLQRKHIWFLSIIGAMLHNVGQICAAAGMMQSMQVFWYLPMLLLVGSITGLFTGLVAQQVCRFLPTFATQTTKSKPVISSCTKRRM